MPALKKFSELPHSFQNYEPAKRSELMRTHYKSYRKVGDRIEEVDTDTYNIKELQQINASELLQKLYEDEDFIIPPHVIGRTLVRVKLGKLYIEYCPGGKCSFRLSIKYIDNTTRTLHSFLNLDVSRMSCIRFENLLPIRLYEYDPYESTPPLFRNGQPDPRGVDFNFQNPLSNAYELKTILTHLMRGEAITNEERLHFQEHYLQLYRPHSSEEITPEVRRREQEPYRQFYSPQSSNVNHSFHPRPIIAEPKKDIQHFGRNPTDKPITLFEVSAKIGAIALTFLSINADVITDVLKEFLECTHQNPDVFNEETIQVILTTFVDKNRLLLKSFIDDIEELMRAAIQKLSPSSHQILDNFVQDEQDHRQSIEDDQWYEYTVMKVAFHSVS